MTIEQCRWFKEEVKTYTYMAKEQMHIIVNGKTWNERRDTIRERLIFSRGEEAARKILAKANQKLKKKAYAY